MIRCILLLVRFADSMSRKGTRGVSEKEWSSPGGTGWDSFRPNIGDVVEVDLSASTYSVASEGFLAIYVTYLEDDVLGGIYMGGKLIGASQTALEDSLIRAISTDEKVIHLCAEVGCSVEEERILFHCTKARWFQARRFKPSYLAPWGELVLGEIRGRKEKPKESGTPGKSEDHARSKVQDPLRRARARVGRGDKKKGLRDRKPKVEELVGGEPAGLRDKLDKLRRKIMGQDAHGVINVPSESEDEDGSGDMSSEDGEKKLKTGSGLNPLTTVLALQDRDGVGDTRDGMVKREKVRKRVKRVKKEEKVRSRPSSALLAVAEQEEERKRKEKKRKKEKKSKGGKGVKALVELLKGKKKKKRKSGMDPSSSGNSSSSSEGSSDLDEESDSSEMLAPLQKRSSRKPGRVLRMLVKHLDAAVLAKGL